MYALGSAGAGAGAGAAVGGVPGALIGGVVVVWQVFRPPRKKKRKE